MSAATSASNSTSQGSAVAVAGSGNAGGGNEITTYGHKASAADKQAIMALVKRFYVAAGQDDGANACSLIYSILAEAIPEDYGQPPGPPSLSGKTCAVVMSKLFRQVPGQPPAVLATTEVTGVRVKGRKGYALLRSKVMPAGDISVELELGTWKVGSLIGSAISGTSAASGAATAATTATAPATAANTPGGHTIEDSNDSDHDPGSNDDESILDYGHAASEPDQRAITAVVKRYYTVTAADDGASACAVMYSVVAEAIPEYYEDSPGLRGKSYAEVMSKVSKQRRRQLAADIAALKVMRVRVEGDKGLALVFFGKTPEPYVLVHRDGGVWKIESLSEIGLP
jgi:hypothetical protein